MSSGSSASFCLIVCFLVGSSEAQENITAELGQNVTLTCKAANNNKPITVVEWNRPELDSVDVLLYRNGRFDPHIQHPSYVNRADLNDREMKDGDISLILKNVTMEDKGRYESRVVQGEIGSTKIDLICIFNLEVLPPGDKDGGDKDGGDKVGGDKVGGDKVGGDKVGGDKDGGDKDGGDKDGGDKVEGDKDGNTGDGGNKAGSIAVSVVVGLILLAAIVGFLIYKRLMKKSHSPVHLYEAEAGKMF